VLKGVDEVLLLLEDLGLNLQVGARADRHLCGFTARMQTCDVRAARSESRKAGVACFQAKPGLHPCPLPRSIPMTSP
jgi:hypothetical protein